MAVSEELPIPVRLTEIDTAYFKIRQIQNEMTKRSFLDIMIDEALGEIRYIDCYLIALAKGVIKNKNTSIWIIPEKTSCLRKRNNSQAGTRKRESHFGRWLSHC